MSSTLRILISLIAGLIAGVMIADSPIAENSGVISGTIGGLWLNALRMTIIPLVFSLLSLGCVRAGAAAGGGTYTLKVFGVYMSLLFFAGLWGAALALFILPIFPAPEAAARALTESAAAAGATIAPSPPLHEMLLGIIPANPFEAASNGVILQIVVFALFFGIALTRIGGEQRVTLTAFLQALSDTLFVIVGWVLKAAPVGVFALGLSLSLRAGASAFGALAHYVLFACFVPFTAIALAYVVAVIGGGVAIFRFARGVAPAQAVAIGTQSSLASLPAMLKSADELDVPSAVSGVTLPLAVSTFRFAGPATTVGVSLYAAALYGVHPSPLLIVAAAALAVIIEQSLVGLPNQVNFFTTFVPVFSILGVPIEILALLVAVDVLPDMTMTTANVSMDVAVTKAIARRMPVNAS